MNESIFGDMLQQFSERFAQGEYFSEIGGGEIGAGVGCVGPLAADLNDTDDFVAQKNRRADNFLNCFAGVDAARFHTFENGRVTRGGKVVVDFGTTLTNSTCGKRGVTRQRNEADIAQRFRKKKVEMTPLVGEAEDTDFFGLYVEIASDAFGNRRPRAWRRFGAGVAKRVGEAFEFGDKAHESSRGEW